MNGEDREVRNEEHSNRQVLLSMFRGLDGTGKFIVTLVFVGVSVLGGLQAVEWVSPGKSGTYVHRAEADSLRKDLNSLKSAVEMQYRALEQSNMRLQITISEYMQKIDAASAEVLRTEVNYGLIRSGELDRRILELSRR
ncbi:hypothetical protein KJZ99_00055 [bacterium]|nr:hypothetical protein [bacterium]